jgi:hypothetical protein
MISTNGIKEKIYIKKHAKDILQELQKERKLNGVTTPCSLERKCIRQIAKDQEEEARKRRMSNRIVVSDED